MRSLKTQTQHIPWSNGHASVHANDRAKERLGRNLSEETARRISNDIKTGRAVFLYKGKLPHQAVFAVLLDGKAVPVVYDKSNRTIVTIMHRNSILNMLNKRLRQLTGENRNE